MKFFYIALHIPTNTTTKHATREEFMSESDFFRTLDKWNRSNPGVWQYYSTTESSKEGT